MYKDIFDYIQYNNFEVTESKIYSILITFTSSILRKEGYICRSTKKYQNMIRKT